MSNLFDKTTSALGTAINMRLMKQNVISSNIANAQTPAFHAKKMDFEDALARALDIDGLRRSATSDCSHFHTGGGAIAHTAPEIYEDPDVAVNNDGNTVDVEKEMSSLADNIIMYKSALHLINKKFASLKYAAVEGR